MDVARSALRLGSNVTVAYRRTREAMPAIPDEVRESEEEGIRFSFLLQPISASRVNGRLSVVFQHMEPGSSDESGRPSVNPKKGEYVTIEADSLIAAVGELVDISWVPERLTNKGQIDPSPGSGIYAGGDAATQPRTIVNAIASAKRAAISMDLAFRGIPVQESLNRIAVGNKGSLSMRSYLQARESGTWPDKEGVVAPDQIRTLYFEKSERLKQKKLSHKKRLQTFSEVNLSPDAKAALLSAARCYSCGRCNACLNCYYFCPEGVIAVDVEQCTRTVDDQHCKGCGTCATACPRNAIEMKDLS